MSRVYPLSVRARGIRVKVDDEGGETSGALVSPRRPRALLVLAHGAGTTRRHESLVLLQDALAARGLASLTFNFPYSEAGRRRPDPMPRLERAYEGALAFARGRRTRPLLAGGRSMGGRVATHLAARGAALDGLVLLGYPLHPRGEPEKLRTEHLPRVACRTLFISGTKDDLATPRLLEKAVRSMPDARLHWIEGADHGLDRRGVSRAERAAEVARLVDEWIGS
jgi:predicted alpha/beta-hydrolase family hydrolase